MSKITVDTAGNWKLYTNTLPANSTATGAYVQVNAGAIRNLDGRKVVAALGMAGRPSEMEGGKRVNVYLDAESLAIAAKLGNGNVSDGIRKALKRRRHLVANEESNELRRTEKSCEEGLTASKFVRIIEPSKLTKELKP